MTNIELKSLITKNIEQAIVELLIYSKGTEHYNTIINLSNQYNKLRDDDIKGILRREESTIETAKLVNALLKITDIIDIPTYIIEKIKVYKPITDYITYIKRLKIFIIFVLILSLFEFALIVYLMTDQMPSVQINSPQNNNSIDNTVNIKGTFSNLKENQMIWIFIYDYSLNKYFPHNECAHLYKETKEWEAINVSIGTNSDNGLSFDIFAVIINNSKDINDIDAYFKQIDRSGMYKLIQGINSTKINVKRN